MQILTTDGDQVVTLQDSGIDGVAGRSGGTGDLVTVTAYEGGRSGTYVYDLGTDRFLRITDGVSSGRWAGPPRDGQFLWDTPADHGDGATQWLGRLLS